MQIVISHVYSADNKGDAALLGVLIQEIKKQFQDQDITILTMDTVQKGETFDSVPVRRSFMYYVNRQSSNKLVWLLYGLTMMVYTLFASWVRRNTGFMMPMPSSWKNLIVRYERADLVIAVGGGYFRTKQSVGSMYDFLLLLHPIVLAKTLRTPTVLYTQSVGPLYRLIERRMLSRVINHSVELAVIREDKSMKLLQSIGVSNITRSVDAGFLLTTDTSALKNMRLRFPKERLILGVTARQWLDGPGQKAYETAMAETLDYMIQKHEAHVVFIPQVTSESQGDDDRITSKAIYESMQEQEHAVVLTENYSYRQIKALYDQLDFLLGTRFHSVIFSLTSYVPAMAIEYEHKTSGIMHDLDLEEWVVKMEDVTSANMMPKMDLLVKNGPCYKEHLAKVLPSYIEEAHDAIVLVKNAYDNSLTK